MVSTRLCPSSLFLETLEEEGRGALRRRRTVSSEAEGERVMVELEIVLSVEMIPTVVMVEKLTCGDMGGLEGGVFVLLSERRRLVTTGQNGKGQERIKRDRTERDRTGEDRTAQDRMGKDRRG